jgi:hypothetical protein
MSTIAQIAFTPRSARLAAPRVVRLVLERGEVYRLTRLAGRVAVLSGTAWLASRGRDFLLRAGEGLDLPPARDTLLSGLGDDPLIVELRP